MTKSALIIGATGLTGGILLNELLSDERYSEIHVLSRRPLSMQHSKLHEHLMDFQNLEAFQSLFSGDECYCCIGTTKAKTPDKKKYRQIDFDIPVNAARLCKQNRIKTFVVMSSLGADAGSSVFYSRIKGQMEQAVLDQKIEKTIVVRPSLIAGTRNERRVGEQIAKVMMDFINPLLVGRLKAYQSIHPKTIAKAMINLANNPIEKSIFTSDELKAKATNDY